MKRGEIHWAALPDPAGRRPVLILTRDVAIPLRTRVTIAHITHRHRSRRFEVPVGSAEGLAERSFVNCDEISTIPLAMLDQQPIGELDPAKLRALDRALRYALSIR